MIGGRYRVFDGMRTFDASLRGRFKYKPGDRVLVGDRVAVHVEADESATIEAVHPRRNVLARRMPGKRRGVRNVAANLDQVVVVGSAAQPLWDHHLIDRFLVVAEANALPAVVVVNKIDLVEDTEPLTTPYRQAGYRVILTSVPAGRGLEELRAELEGKASFFTGSTGVGKSSLLNALQPGLRLRTGVVSRRMGAGRHITVAAEMYRFGRDGFVVDTPGLRDIGLWGIDPLEVVRTFPEFAPYASRCRFDNCRHVEEPGCAVVEACARGELAPSRLHSYRRFLEEAHRAARPWER